MSLKDEQLRLVAAAVVEVRPLSWVPLHSPRASWRRILELSNSMDPTQDTGNQLKEVENAAGTRLQNCSGFAQGSIGQVCVPLGRGALFGTCEECVGEPPTTPQATIGPTVLNSDQLRLDAATMGVGLLL